MGIQQAELLQNLLVMADRDSGHVEAVMPLEVFVAANFPDEAVCADWNPKSFLEAMSQPGARTNHQYDMSGVYDFYLLSATDQLEHSGSCPAYLEVAADGNTILYTEKPGVTAAGSVVLTLTEATDISAA